MKKTNLILAFIAFSFFGLSQNPYWILPPKVADVSSGNPLISPLPTPTTYFGEPGTGITIPYEGYMGQSAKNSANMISKEDGSILFFIVDEYIYDNNGYIIDYMDVNFSQGGNSGIRGTAETMIVPNPGNCQQYYIFSTYISGYKKIPYVFLLDLSLPNIYNNPGYPTKGALITIGTSGLKGKKINEIEPLFQYAAPGSGDSKLANVYFACSPLRSATNDYLVFISEGSGIFKFRITSSGIFSDGLNNNFGNIEFNTYYSRSEMELTKLDNGNYRIATTYNPSLSTSGGVKQLIYTASLNSSGSLISGSEKTFPMYNVANDASVSGLEFSKNGRYLYVTHSTNTTQPNQLEYYDYNVPTTNLIPLSVPAGIDLRFSQIELGLGNILYFANQNGIYAKANSDNPSSLITAAAGFTYQISTESSGAMLSLPSMYRYLLPDQIDNSDYDAHFTATPQCCIDNNSYTRDFYTATANQTWSNTTVNPLSSSVTGTITIKNELRIPAGKTVTINNMIFKFAPGAKVIVEHGTNGNPGGRLILNNTTFTVDNSCGANKMWLGVEVWGNQNVAQTNVSHGKLTMTNNSRIEHAHVGVLLSQRVGNNIYVFNDARNCGIVQATNSTFYNNMRGAWFRKHISKVFLGTNNSLSFFKNCEFLWQNALLEGGPREHIRMESVKGVRILGSDLKQLSPQLYTPSTTGVGIRSYESVFYVNEYCPYTISYGTPCPVFDPCNFDHLSYGVFTTSSNGENYLVNKSNFINCRYGIFTTGAAKERITLNTFKVAELPYQSAGVVVINSTGYKIEENTFEEFNNPLVAHGSGQSYGILVRNSGTVHNEVYKNTFMNLKIGGQSEAINGINDGTPNNPSRLGLQWKCNTFKSDIYETDLGVNGIIDYNQGYLFSTPLALSIQSAARNEFSLSGENPLAYPEHDIKVFVPNTPVFSYIHIAAVPHIPDNYTTIVAVNDQQYNGGPLTQTTNACPSKLSNKFSDFLFKFNSVLNDIDELDSTIASEAPNSPNMENLLYNRKRLISEKVDIFNEICSRYKLNEGLENVAFDYVQFLTDLNEPMAWSELLQYNIDRGELSNNALRTSLTGIESSEYLELTTIQEALQPTESTQYALEQDTGTVAQLQQIINLANEFDAARVMCLLNLINGDQEVADFMPLGSSNHAPIHFDETEYFGVPTGVNMYPNPSEGIVFFNSINEEVNLTKIELYDLSGVKILEHEIQDVNSAKLDYNHISSGTYLVKISTSTGRVETKKLMIK